MSETYATLACVDTYGVLFVLLEEQSGAQSFGNLRSLLEKRHMHLHKQRWCAAHNVAVECAHFASVEELQWLLKDATQTQQKLRVMLNVSLPPLCAAETLLCDAYAFLVDVLRVSVRHAGQYGAHFAVYEGDPATTHSTQLVVVCRETPDDAELATLARVARSVKKRAALLLMPPGGAPQLQTLLSL